MTPIPDSDVPWTWWGNTIAAWTTTVICAVVLVAAVFIVMRIVRRRVLPTLRARQGAMVRGLAAAIDAVRMRYVAPIAILFSTGFLTLPHRLEYWLNLAGFVLVGLQLVLAINRLIVSALAYATAPELGHERPVMLTIISWTARLVVWLSFLLAVLAALGVNITAFVASLGVGGIAVALALQNILGDLFASVSIGLDKPFEPGEFIAFDEGLGTVRHIGVKSTRIVSQSGEELAIANSKLLEKLTHNYSRMNERRVAFGFTVPYSATRAQLSGITGRVNDFIAGLEQVRFDRGHLIDFGDAGFTFEFVYYVLDPDYALYRDLHQRIMGEIVDVAADLGVPFAVPARRVEIGGGRAGD
jgi:small-conductance mechanosensitive channel